MQVMRLCFRFIAGVLAITSAFAQPPLQRTQYIVRGEITAPGAGLGSLTVESSSNGNGISETVGVNPDGSFELHSPSPGMHEIRVSTTAGRVVHQEQIYISGPESHLSINLSDAMNATRSSENATISLRQLQHKIPAAAQKAYVRGQKAMSKGDEAQAAQFFLEAVRLDPEYADAHNNLGSAYTEQGKLTEAADEFQKAIDLEPEHRLALPNLAIVLAKMKRYHDAEGVARRALKLYPSMGRMRFILASSILAAHGDSAEALDNLQRAVAEVPKAHLLAADLLWQQGRRDQAIEHLEDYLKVAPQDDPQRPKVKALLAQWRQP